MRCGAVRLIRALIEQKRHPSAGLLPRVVQPTLVLRGRKDMVVSPDRMRAVSTAIPHARSVTIPGAHGAHFSHAPDFAREVAHFLNVVQG